MTVRHLRPADQTPVARLEELMAEASAIARGLDQDQAIAAVGELEKVKARLWQRVLADPHVPETGDKLLSAKVAAAILDVPEKALYRESWCRIFTVKLSEGRTRFSELEIRRFLKSKLGRP